MTRKLILLSSLALTSSMAQAQVAQVFLRKNIARITFETSSEPNRSHTITLRSKSRMIKGLGFDPHGSVPAWSSCSVSSSTGPWYSKHEFVTIHHGKVYQDQSNIGWGDLLSAQGDNYTNGNLVVKYARGPQHIRLSKSAYQPLLVRAYEVAEGISRIAKDAEETYRFDRADDASNNRDGASALAILGGQASLEALVEACGSQFGV